MQILRTLVAVGVAATQTFSPSRHARSELVLVKSVIDGDTITVTTVGRVRLLGIDAPDRKSTRLNSSHIQKSRMPSSA